MLKLNYFITILFILPSAVFSQNIQHDYALSCDSVLSIYKQEIHNKNDYILGVEYKLYHNYKQDNPYFQSRHGKGTIYSKGYKYDNKIICYDIFKDVLTVNPVLEKSNNNNNNIQLQKTQIDSFLIEFNNLEYLFKHIKNNNFGSNQIKSGFYEIPYTGKFHLLYKHVVKKTALEGTTTYSHQIKKFLKIKNAHYNINKQQEFFELFPSKKKLIKKKIRSLKISYRKFTTRHLIELIKFTETL